MKRSAKTGKTPHKLSKTISHQLNMYALAAGAAGVGTLAIPPAQAKIVYTPAHVVIQRGVNYGIDLNHDRANDFQINNSYLVTQNGFRSARLLPYGKVQGNKIEGQFVTSSVSYVNALRRGAKIGRSRNFISGADMLYSGYYGERGKWDNVKGRYLGLQFLIDGKIHYGWGRLNVTLVKGTKIRITATLTGYAYETIPGKPIIAGATKGTDDPEPAASLKTPTRAPTTLSALALGAPALSIWRREESVVPTSGRN